MEKKKRASYVVLILSLILLIANFIMAYPDDLDKAFYMRILANVILIAAMMLSIRKFKKQEKSGN